MANVTQPLPAALLGRGYLRSSLLAVQYLRHRRNGESFNRRPALARRASRRRRRHFRRPLRHLHRPGEQAAVLGLPATAVVSVAARPRGPAPLARREPRSPDAGNADRRPRRPPLLGPRGDPLPHSSAPPPVVGGAAGLFPREHVAV